MVVGATRAPRPSRPGRLARLAPGRHRGEGGGRRGARLVGGTAQRVGLARQAHLALAGPLGGVGRRQAHQQLAPDGEREAAVVQQLECHRIAGAPQAAAGLGERLVGGGGRDLARAVVALGHQSRDAQAPARWRESAPRLLEQRHLGAHRLDREAQDLEAQPTGDGAHHSWAG